MSVGDATKTPPFRRIALQGTSSSGKSTLGRLLASRLGAQHLELDSIFHLPNWTPIETEEFRRIVSEFVQQDSWVTDGNYTMVRDLYWARAEVVVFLDLPKRVIMFRVIRRTLTRILRRQELWNGNRERLRNIFSRKPELNIILWAWTTYGKYSNLVPDEARAADLGIPIIMLRSRREVRAFANQFVPE